MKTQRSAVNLSSSTPLHHTLDKLDQNYVWSGNNIGVGYVFEGTIDVSRLTASLAQLVEEFPALTGRADFKAMTVLTSSKGIPIEHSSEHPGGARDYSLMGENIRNRSDFVSEFSLKDIKRGKAPLMAVKLTEFVNGGCILGVTINHGLMDAAGFNRVMHRWSDLYTGQVSAPLKQDSKIASFGTDRSKAQLWTDIKAAGISKPLNFNGPVGRVLNSMMFGGLEKIRARGREMIHITPDHVAALKTAVQEESGLDWISTNIAVGAHILWAIAPLQLSNKIQSVNIGNVVNIRSRIPAQHDAESALFVGNALYIMITELAASHSISDLTRADFARHLRKTFDEMTPETITRDMHNTVDSLNAGYGYPGLSLFKPMMALNNQSKMNIYGLDFGAGRLLRVIPHDVGDHVMIYPAADGGLEVYIRDFASLKRQKKLLDAKWQARLRSYA